MKKGGTFRWITHKGETKTLAEWARVTGMDRKTISDRIDVSGWSIERALDTPPIIPPGGTRAMKEYKSWIHMKHRCYCPSYKSFHRYGGRGIKVCDQWLHDFWQFYKDIGPAPGKGRYYSIDRINNEGHYEPDNCRWATPMQQSHNRSISKNKT